MAEQQQSRSRSAAKKVLMPVVATVASALASYVAKKGPEFLEQTVLPKLREGKSGAGDVAHDLTERARSVAGGGGSNGGGDGESRSNDELEGRRRERAEHRAARRKAS